MTPKSAITAKSARVRSAAEKPSAKAQAAKAPSAALSSATSVVEVVSAAASRPVAPIKSFPAMPARDADGSKTGGKSAASVKPSAPARRASRETQRVGEARELAPPSSRPVFSRDFLARQRERLAAKKEEILAMYKKDLQSGQESNDSPTEDIVDRANNAYSRELAFSISDNERELMLQIDQAIERLNASTYGYCLHTGQPIGLARLEAIPWAKYGVEAQEMLEKGLLSEA